MSAAFAEALVVGHREFPVALNESTMPRLGEFASPTCKKNSAVSSTCMVYGSAGFRDHAQVAVPTPKTFRNALTFLSQILWRLRIADRIELDSPLLRCSVF